MEIKKSHKGLFTKKAKSHNMGVQEFAKHVLSHKEDYPTSTIKQANFARNAKKFKHQDGGYQNNTGYLPNYSTSNNPFNVIPSNTITMQGVPHPILAISNKGEVKYLPANSKLHKFKGNKVFELPIYQLGSYYNDSYVREPLNIQTYTSTIPDLKVNPNISIIPKQPEPLRKDTAFNINSALNPDMLKQSQDRVNQLLVEKQKEQKDYAKQVLRNSRQQKFANTLDQIGQFGAPIFGLQQGLYALSNMVEQRRQLNSAYSRMATDFNDTFSYAPIDYGSSDNQAYGYYKAGGLTPNKARQILHDKYIKGKKLTDKQRKFFGAMSQGNTLKYEEGGDVEQNNYETDPYNYEIDPLTFLYDEQDSQDQTQAQDEEDLSYMDENDKLAMEILSWNTDTDLRLNKNRDDINTDSSEVIPTGDINYKSELKGNSIAAKNNNPGNIKYASWMQKYGAVPGSTATDGGRFAKFPTVSHALKAREALLKGKLYANKTVDEALTLYSGKGGYNGSIYPQIRHKKMRDLTESEMDELTKRQIIREDRKVAKQLGLI